MKINDPLELPCGVVLPNRLGKSAMSENMASPGHIAGEEFYNAYKMWSDGGIGVCITGNVMIDSRHLGEPNNVVIEKGLDNHEGLKRWASAGKNIWPQLNHPGKQTPKFLTKEPVSPSAVALQGSLRKMFNTPRALTQEEILDIISRFAYAAKVVKDCGFGGVQIHGAHGYLVSQFLSPHHNQRTDHWGGSVEKRFNFVKEVYLAIRDAVGAKFPIGIKINSADFTKGGFTNEESIYITKNLSQLGIDLIELSGGSYEKPVMMGVPIKESTKKREAYFLEFSSEIKKHLTCPLMVTGGFRTREFMNEALDNKELDIVGLARPLCVNPNWPNQLLRGEDVQSEVKPLTSGFKFIDSIVPLEIVWYTRQIHRMGRRQMPKKDAGVYPTIFSTLMDTGLQIFKKVRGI